MQSLHQAIDANRRAVLALSQPELTRLLPVLHEIRRETITELAKFLKTATPDETFTSLRRKALLAQLQHVIKIAETKVPAAMVSQLGGPLPTHSKDALSKLLAMIQGGEKKFAGAITTLRLPAASVLADTKKVLMRRYPGSARRYAGSVGRAIQRDVLIGQVKGETMGSVVRRLLGHSGADLTPGQIAKGVAKRQFFRNHADAERLVRTEWNHAHNFVQTSALVEMDDDEGGWWKKWDAANDARVCLKCFKVDGEIVRPHATFSCGCKHPPLHPNDRCCVIPWRLEWGK